ncbi:MAG TPA: nuclear transport factor 2 family protein [Steroidobacteraceae bacterium]|nr:nuclear transport factor 2 family protein [Steroidobacteraceae bacterium]
MSSAGATLALTLSCLALAQQPPAAPAAAPASPALRAAAQPELAQLLEARVRAAWEAFRKKDRAGYAKFLTDDFQAVEADGEGERNRLHVLGEVEHCMYSSYLLQFFQVQPLGPDHAFITYESTMQFPKTAALRYRRVFVGELWTRQNGQWKMMRYQETLVR